MEVKTDWKKYLIAFLITVIIFATAILLSNYLNNKRTDNLRLIQSKIATDILSSETQYALLTESSCNDIGNTTLSDELNNLGQKLTFQENNLSASRDELIQLKTYYSLLQIKDYLLVKKIIEKCNRKNVSILYFYEKDCSDCNEQGYVLTYLREQYPDLRVYSFDMDLNNPALQTLASIYKIGDEYPVLVINENTYDGLANRDKILKVLPSWLVSTSTATTTKATSTSVKK
jgi:hypothetical protein